MRPDDMTTHTGRSDKGKLLFGRAGYRIGYHLIALSGDRQS